MRSISSTHIVNKSVIHKQIPSWTIQTYQAYQTISNLSKSFHTIQPYPKAIQTNAKLSKHIKTLTKPFKPFQNLLKDLSKTFQNFFQYLSKPYPKPIQTYPHFSKPIQTYSKTTSNLSIQTYPNLS